MKLLSRYRGESLFHWIPVAIFPNVISHVDPIQYILHWYAVSPKEYEESIRRRIGKQLLECFGQVKFISICLDSAIREASWNQGKEMKT